MKCEAKCGLMAIETRTEYKIVGFLNIIAVVKNLCRGCARLWDAQEVKQ